MIEGRVRRLQREGRVRRATVVAVVVLALAGATASTVGAQIILPPLGPTTTTAPPPPPTTAPPPPTTSPPPTSPPATDPPPTTPPPTSPPPTSPPATSAPGGATSPAPEPTRPAANTPAAADPPAQSGGSAAPAATAEGVGVQPADPGGFTDGPKAEILPPKADESPVPSPLTVLNSASPNSPRLGDAAVDAILNSLQRSGASSTIALVNALRELEAYGFDEREAATLAFGSFPVAGRATYRDDFHDARLTPTFHLHQGNDIFAPFDTPVKSPVDGILRYADEAVGGKSAYVTAPDGTFYYMAHLSGFSPDLASGARVQSGDVVGFTGDTGNAVGGAPHVHFEIHPGGGAAINPKPILDAWLNEALARLPEVIASYRDRYPQVLIATGITRRFDFTGFQEAPRPSVDSLMWASSVSPGGGGMVLAQAAVARAAERIDWSRRTAVAQAKAVLAQRANDMAASVLDPLTPPVMAGALDHREAAG